MACCQQDGSISNCWLSRPNSARFRLRREGSVAGSTRAEVSNTPPAQPAAIAFHLVFGQDDEEVGLAGGHHGAQDPRAETHVAGDRAAALAHAVDFGLLHVQAGEEGGLGQDVRRFEHPLAAQAGDDDIGNALVHPDTVGLRSCWYCLILPAANRQGRRAIMTVSVPEARLRRKRR